MTAPITEEKIKTDIVNELFWGNRVNLANIVVMVILSGTVAYDAAFYTEGVMDIKDKLSIAEPVA